MTDEPTIVPDDENPEWTAEDFARSRPGAEVLPAAVLDAFARKRGRPRLASAKTAVSLRLDPDVLDYYRSTGGGWQGRINDILRRSMGKSSAG